MFLFPHGVDHFFKIMSSSSEIAVTLRTHLERGHRTIIYYRFIIYSKTDLDRAEILAKSAQKVSIGATKDLSISLKPLKTNLKSFITNN